MQKNGKSRNELIQMMRGVGALTVYIWHIHNRYLDYVFKGYLANTFFFFLAAFFVGQAIYSKSDAIANFNVFAFLKKRLHKVYPLYILTTIAMAAFAIVGGGTARRYILQEINSSSFAN